MSKKTIIMIVLVVVCMLLAVGTTYAIYTWDYDVTVSGQGECFEVVYVKGRDIGSNESSKTIMMGRYYYDGLSTTVEVKLKDTCSVENGKATLYLNTDSTTGSEILSSNALMYQVIDGNTISSSGTINSTGKMILASDIDITKNDKAITVFVWINGEYVTDENYEEIMSSTYNGSISLEVESR